MGKRALASPHIEVTGIHCHIGRQAKGSEHWKKYIKGYVKLIAELRDKWNGWIPREIDFGGGFPEPRDAIGKD